MRRLRAIWMLLFHREAVESELDEELRAFYETMVERYVSQGMPESEARRLARLRFSGQEQVKEEVRDARSGAAISSAMRDLNYAFRTIRKAPVAAFVTVLTLALGIGANATIFSIVSRFVFHTPPIGNPASLMAIHTTYDGGRCCNSFSWPLFTDVRDTASSFSGLAAYYDLFPASIGGAGEPERVWGQATTTNFFTVSEMSMTAGRGFAPDEEHRDVAVLGYSLWQRRFGGDPAIAGKTIHLSGRPFTVVGVAAPEFRGLDVILNSQFWVPFGALDALLPNTSNLSSREYHWINPVGRLKPDISQTQAAAELAVLAQRLRKAHPATDKGIGFRSEQAGSLPPRGKGPILLFFAGLSAVALFVLLIACANVANIRLAQASARRREMAVRVALGASRGRLLRQVMTESVLLALGGGVLGVAISFWATRGLGALRFPAPVPLDIAVSVDWRVLLHAFALSAAAGILLGLMPGWAATRSLTAGALRGEEMLSRPGSIWSLRNALVVFQIAMSLVLLCVTGLFLRSLGNASQIQIGFRPRGVLMMSVDPRLHGYSAERTVQFLNLLRTRVAALPGVVSTACTDAVPLSGGFRSDGFVVEGRPSPPDPGRSVDLFMATPGYFQTLGIPLVAGHGFRNDSAASPRVAVVNEAFAKSFFPNEDPLGRRVRSGDRSYEIIGVTGNIKSRTLGEDLRPVLYRALAQDIEKDPSFAGYSILVQFSRDPRAVAGAVRSEIHALDPTLAVYNAQTMEEHVRDALFLPRLGATLFGVFGFIGLLLAAMGLYSVISHWVSRRTREIGIRVAIGARSGEVQQLIVRQGMTLAALAFVPGFGGAWAMAKVFSSFLYGVPAHDGAIFTLVPVFLAATALLACWLPARRAARVDPSVTLRHE